MLEIKNNAREIMSQMGSLTDWKRISEWENKSMEISQTETQRGKRMNETGQNIQQPKDNFKRCNIHTIEMSEEKERSNSWSNN